MYEIFSKSLPSSKVLSVLKLRVTVSLGLIVVVSPSGACQRILQSSSLTFRLCQTSIGSSLLFVIVQVILLNYHLSLTLPGLLHCKNALHVHPHSNLTSGNCTSTIFTRIVPRLYQLPFFLYNSFTFTLPS